MVTPNRPMVEYALLLALKGLYVFPITPGEKAPPLLREWQKYATTDPDRIRTWWLRHPDANIGCHVGASGHVVLDIDVKNGVDGFASLRKLRPDMGSSLVSGCETPVLDLPPTGWNVETPSGGLHIWYKLPNGVEVGNSVGKLGEGIDVRSLNGYVLMPPSRLDAGNDFNGNNFYTWQPPVRFPKVTGS